MKLNCFWGMCGAVIVMAMFASTSCFAQVYPPPPGGWTYFYDGGSAPSAPDWSHDNGSDEWDETGIGTGRPGGASSIDGYLRIQDTGDPRDYGMGDPGSNRKLYFGHDITAEGAAGNVLDTGVILSFRARIASGDPVDQLHPDGGGGVVPWVDGDGYVIHDGGKGNFSIKQADGGVISFALAGDIEDATSFPGGGLIMNHLNGTAVSGDVDWQGDEAGTQNLLSLDPTQWHEFWITIEAGGAGTHVVNVSTDGSLTPTTFDVTAGSGSDFDGSYIAMGAGATPQHGAIDVDFFAWSPIPEPCGLALAIFGLMGLMAAARRRR